MENLLYIIMLILNVKCTLSISWWISFHVADDNQGVRQVSAAGHRVQDPEHQLPDYLPRGGAVFTEQVPHAASWSQPLLPHHGGHRQESGYDVV